jgi:adenylate kinase
VDTPNGVIVVTGTPAAGKSTAIRALLERWPDLAHFGIRRFLGGEIARGTETGLRALDLSSRLRWLPDEFIAEIFSGWLDVHLSATGWVVESFPRNGDQARMLQRIVAERGLETLCVLTFDAPDSVLLARSAARTVCLSCDGPIADTVPEPGAACPRCGGPLVRRKDDAVPVFSDRMRAYRESFGEVAEAYEGNAPVCRIDGSRSREEVRSATFSAITQSSRSARRRRAASGAATRAPTARGADDAAVRRP